MRSLGRSLGCGVILLAGIILSGCDMNNSSVASVGSASINQDDYLTMLEIGPGARGMTAGQAAMDQMIQNQLIMQEADRQKVAPTQTELEAVMNDLRSRPEFQANKQKTGLTDEQVMRLLIQPQLSLAGLMSKLAGVTDADVLKYFQQHKAELGEPAQVRARVLPFTDRKKAQDALNLAGKSSPEVIAQTLVGDSAAAQVMSLRKQGSPFPQAVVDAAFATKKGQHTGIIEATPAPNFMQPQAPAPGKQYFIVFVEDVLPARQADIKNPLTRNNVKQILAQQKMSQGGLAPTAFEDMIKNLRSEAAKKNEINVIRPTVKSVEKGPPPAPANPMMGGPQ